MYLLPNTQTEYNTEIVKIYYTNCVHNEMENLYLIEFEKSEILISIPCTYNM